MWQRPFLDHSKPPTGQALQAALGAVYPCYENILELAGGYAREWSFTKGSGWILQVSGRKKALFYLIPLKDGFKISLAIREMEREAFLIDGDLLILRDKISSSKKVSEGYALQFQIAGQNDAQILGLFLNKLIAIRG